MLVVFSSGLLVLKAVPGIFSVPEIALPTHFDWEAAQRIMHNEPLSTWMGISRLDLDYPAGSSASMAY
jgi:hypothetical protein